MPDRFAGALGLMRFLFNYAAEQDAAIVAVTRAPLAADFVAWVGPQPLDRVLDVGTGTGQIAHLVTPHACTVVGLDVAQAALRVGRAGWWPVVADLHHPPFAAQQFDLITASFSLNATDPARSLRALRRLLVPGGRLAIQEWGPMTALDHAFGDAFADCLCADPPAPLAALRAALIAWPGRWGDHVQDMEDYGAWLHAAGFRAVHATEAAPVALSLSLEQFVAYKLAPADRQAELAALAADARAACMAEIRARLGAFATPAGDVVWRPVVFRVQARV